MSLFSSIFGGLSSVMAKGEERSGEVDCGVCSFACGISCGYDCTGWCGTNCDNSCSSNDTTGLTLSICDDCHYNCNDTCRTRLALTK